MKKLFCVCICGALFLTVQAEAIEIRGQAGEHYTNAEVGFGTGSSGLYGTLNWAHSDNDGDVAGLGLGINVPLGPFIASVGGKALYLNPDQGDDGYAAAVGGGLQWPLAHGFSLYGNGYYAPDSLSSGVNNYVEAAGGVRWNIMRPVSVDVGYRYMNMEGKNGNRDNVLADGPYLGVGIGF